MGFWYFLLLFLGLFLVMKGLFMKKPSLVVHKISFVIVGFSVCHYHFFMFSPGSAEIMAKLLHMN